MAAQQRERHFQGADRYATSLFYGGQPERHDSRSAFGATYSNGQARPVTAIAPTTRPVARPVASPAQPSIAVPSNGGSFHDGVVFSLETRGLGNTSSSSPDRTSTFQSASRRAERGNAVGPLYSNDFRNALDSLLG